MTQIIVKSVCTGVHTCVTVQVYMCTVVSTVACHSPVVAGGEMVALYQLNCASAVGFIQAEEELSSDYSQEYQG